MSTTGKRAFLGLDVGGTFLKAARVDEAGVIETQLKEPIVRDSPEGLLAQLEKAIGALARGASVPAVGLGVPGIVDHATSRLRAVPNLPALAALQDRLLREELTRRAGCPAFIENDANAAGLAEAWLGGGRGAGSELFLTLGTGVGGALILDGRLWTGRSGYAGEIGHVQLDPGGEPCGCGSRGCLETIVGIRGWTRRAEERLRTRPSALAGRALDPEAIVAAARGGDAVGLEIVDETARALGQALGAALNLLNVERIVIGGGISAAGDFLLDRVVAETRSRCWPQAFADCSFRLAELGSEAGVVGAARVAMLGVGGPQPV